MKKTLIYISVFALIMTMFAVPVFAEEVPCPDCGCVECCCPTFPCYGDPCTPGYWKNHAELWMDRTDLPVVNDSAEWLKILNTPSNAGPWYQLAKQYIAACLNLNVGDVEYVEGGEDVEAAMVAAEKLLLGSPETIDRQTALELKDFLDIFNNYDRTE